MRSIEASRWGLCRKVVRAYRYRAQQAAQNTCSLTYKVVQDSKPALRDGLESRHTKQKVCPAKSCTAGSTCSGQLVYCCFSVFGMKEGVAHTTQ